jgi:integrase
MARTTRAPSLQSRDGRLRLPRGDDINWQTIHEGLAIGYRNGRRGGSWWARRRHGSRYVKVRLGIADDTKDADGHTVLDYKQAHRKALELNDAEIEANEKPIIASAYTVGQVLTEYLRSHRLHGKGADQTEKTVKAHILPYFEDRLVEALTAREIQRWFEKLATAPARIRGITKTREIDPNDSEGMRKRKATANRIATILKAALNHAYANGRTKNADAWRRVKPFRSVDAPKIRHLSEDECARLMNACGENLRNLVRGALLTGCRFGELANLQGSDYSPDGGTIIVRESKAGKPRHVPLTTEGQQFFARLTAGRKSADRVFTMTNGESWTKNYYTRPLRQACERAGIDPPASFHVLRHSYGSLLAMRGVPLQVIAAAMGHADTRMTERHYAHLSPSFVADTIRANLPSFGVDLTNVKPLRSRKK